MHPAYEERRSRFLHRKLSYAQRKPSQFAIAKVLPGEPAQHRSRSPTTTKVRLPTV